MKETCYLFEIDVITAKNGAISKRERFPYVAEAGTFEEARAIAANYGQTIARMRNSQKDICYYRVTHVD